MAQRPKAAILLAVICILAAKVVAQETGTPENTAVPQPASAVPTAAAAANSTLSAACQAKLQQLKFESNLPVVMIQLKNTSQVVGATPGQLQLVQKGPHLPGLMTTCGTPGGWSFMPSALCQQLATGAFVLARR